MSVLLTPLVDSYKRYIINTGSLTESSWLLEEGPLTIRAEQISSPKTTMLTIFVEMYDSPSKQTDVNIFVELSRILS